MNIHNYLNSFYPKSSNINVKKYFQAGLLFPNSGYKGLDDSPTTMYKFDTLYLMNKRSESPGPVYNWQGKRILIVEDDYVNYLFFHEILSFSYACLIRAVSLQEAFDMLASDNRYDLIIINTAIQGNENCRSVKRVKLLWPHIRVIAIAGCMCGNKNQRCFPTGCDTMITRDIDSYDMCNVVNEMFFPVN